MKLEYLSASRIKTFYHCPLQYHATYELCLKEEHTHPLTIMGKSVHKVFEISANARMSGRRKYLWNPIGLLPSSNIKYSVEKNLYSLAEELCQNCIDWNYFGQIDRCVGNEVKFYEALADGTMFKGYIDRLDITGNKANVIDLKTQKRAFTQSQLDNNWQAKIYNIATRRLFPQVTDDVKVSFWVLRHQVQTVTLTAEDARIDSEELISVADEIRAARNPVGNKTPLCNWCRYQDDCPDQKIGVKAKFKARWKNGS